jgi:predicted Zn-dependent protease
MKSKALTIPFAAMIIGLTLSVAGLSSADAQYGRKLPKAGFPTGPSGSSFGGTTALPRVNGLHLMDGLDQGPLPPQNIQGGGNGNDNGPYNPGEQAVNWQRVRWEAKKMPLMIWISPGLKLPDCPFSQIQGTRVDTVTNMLQSPEPWSLTQAPSWTPETNDQVAAGIEQWREFEKEGLFSFVFTDDPRNANIMVFFTDSFKESDSPGGIAVGGITSAQIYPIAQAQKMKIRQKPVIIELSTMVNGTPVKMQGATAHEFGHALGIKAHSQGMWDIMNVNRVTNVLSPADKATIRYLYHQPVQWVM